MSNREYFHDLVLKYPQTFPFVPRSHRGRLTAHSLFLEEILRHTVVVMVSATLKKIMLFCKHCLHVASFCFPTGDVCEKKRNQRGLMEQ